MKAFNTLRLAINTARWSMAGNFANVQEAYDDASATYDSYYGRHLGSVTDKFAAYIPLRGRETVLELAAGTGRLTSAICERLHGGAHVAAVDLSAKMLAINRSKNQRMNALSLQGPYVDFRQGDALDALSVQPDRSVDAVLCAWGICYMNHDLLRMQVERVLRPGGIVAFLESRRSNLQEVRGLFDKLIINRPRYLRKAIKLNLPEDASHLVRKFCSGALKEVHSANGKLGVTYESPAEVREYMLKSGASAGFLDAIEPDYREDFMHAFERLVAAQSVRVPLLHQYCMLIARKP